MAAKATAPDLKRLSELALKHGGYFDRADALALGLSNSLIYYHVRAGSFERVDPGVFRLRIAPFSQQDDLWRAVVWSNYRGVVSHESALLLYDLSDVLPGKVHLTVPPEFNRHPPRGLVTHHARLEPDEITLMEGMRVTTPARTIVDAAAYGIDPEQIQIAIRQSIQRALTTPARIRHAATRRGYRWSRNVRVLIEATLLSQRADPDA